MKRFILPLVMILVEAYFFYSRETMDNELFFFTWTFIFGAFFLFRFVDGRTSAGGIGRGSRDVVHNLSIKAAEIMTGADKVKQTRVPLKDDLLLLGLCLVNLVLTFLVPGI